jgi:hypothetical protein
MKRMLVMIVAASALVLGTEAQVSHDYYVGDREPLMTTSLSVDQIPPAIVEAVRTQFSKDNPQTWSKFPFALQEYGWVYDIGSSDVILDRYEVTMKTTNNTELWAVYTAKGELVETREMSTNITIPADIMEKFKNSQYKDWKIVGNKEIIKFYHDHSLDKSKIEQHFRLNVEKDGVKRAISFNWKGSN